MCKHKYQKFDDASLFCERCGERKVIADERPPQTVYVPTIPYVPPLPYYYPWAPYIPPTWPHYTYEVWSDTGGGASVQTIDTTVFGDANKAWFPQQAVNTNAIGGPQMYTPRGVKS